MTKTAVLNNTQLKFLEDAVALHGNVVTSDQLAPLAPGKDIVAKRQFISQVAQAGWLVRIKRGVYQVADMTSLGALTLSRYVVAQLLAPGSYVSFEAALQFHGLHDQLMLATTSVSRQQRATVELHGYRYRFVKTTEQNFYGFEEHTLDGQIAQIATVEKALIDMIQLHRSAHSTDRVAEVLANAHDSLDIERLTCYLRRANLTTQRIFGLLFDALEIAYDDAYLASARQGQATGKMTPDSHEYSAKWRLYYDADLLARYTHQ